MQSLGPPLITIGMTCYNAAESIERALSSAAAQDWPNLEILVVDDCSFDGSVDKVSAMIVKEPRIRVVRHEKNRGVAAARNSILAHAKGDFVCFFDDDDQSEPNRVTMQYEAIRQCEKTTGSGLVICHTARLQTMPDGSRHYEATMVADEPERQPFGEAVMRFILIGQPLAASRGAMATCSQMARLSTYEDVGGFDENLRRSEDTDINVRLAQKGCMFVGLADPLVRQTMTVSSEKNIEDERAFAHMWLMGHKSYLEKIGWWAHTLHWLDLKYDFLAGKRLAFLRSFMFLMLVYPAKTVQRLIWAMPNLRYNRQQANYNKTYLK